MDGNEDLTGLLFKFLLQQGAESFNGSSVNYQYFKIIFNESVEDKIGDPTQRLTRLKEKPKN